MLHSERGAVTARCSSNPAFVVCPDQTLMEVISAHQVWLDATPSADITAIRARHTSNMRAGHSEGLWAAQLPSSSAAWAARAVHGNRASSLGRCSRSRLQPSAKSLTARSSLGCTLNQAQCSCDAAVIACTGKTAMRVVSTH